MSRRIHPFIAAAPVAWLADHGGLPEGVDGGQLHSPDGVPVETQRRLLEEVAARGGEAALLTLAGALGGATDQPLLFVMLNSRSVDDFLDKEQRFNRFFHSDHRVRVLERAERRVVLEHHGERDTPARVESLYVLGIHLEMFGLLGCQELSFALADSSEPTRRLQRGTGLELPAGGCARWRIGWERFTPRREPMPGLDELLLAQAAPRDLAEDDSVAGRVERIVAGDLAHRWTLGEVAAALHTSGRTLQRELSQADTSFSRVLDRIRVQSAARMLRDPARSVTEVGYVCGFSDGAHFSRRFKAHMGAPPASWRKAQH
ncbi:MAG: AraC family transcriptional regulator [Myxococcales bacterium]|nr:AraC family transcriptional regulator [Myxococcales bacterium]